MALAELCERHYATMVWVTCSMLLDRPLAEEAGEKS
jgi:hypothetical protein